MCRWADDMRATKSGGKNCRGSGIQAARWGMGRRRIGDAHARTSSAGGSSDSMVPGRNVSSLMARRQGHLLGVGCKRQLSMAGELPVHRRLRLGNRDGAAGQVQQQRVCHLHGGADQTVFSNPLHCRAAGEPSWNQLSLLHTVPATEDASTVVSNLPCDLRKACRNEIPGAPEPPAPEAPRGRRSPPACAPLRRILSLFHLSLNHCKI